MRTFPCLAGLALLFATSGLSAGEPALRILSPVAHQVVQREGFEPSHAQIHQIGGPRLGFADVKIKAEASGMEGPCQVEFRTVPLTDAFGIGCDWTKIECRLADRQIVATARIPAGGWYRLELRCTCGGKSVTAAVEPFGVGELFLVSGQSYAAGANQEMLKVEDPQGRVVAYDVMQTTWRVAHDPQPNAGARGTLWPALGNLLLPLVRVPVGFVDVAVGGTASAEWMPGEKLYRNFLAGGLSLGRFRAVLWQQGESDVLHGTTAAQYVENLTTIHRALDAAWGFSPPWLLAKSTLHLPAYNNPPGEQIIREALEELGHRPGFLPGPDTDILGGENRSILVSEGRHFTSIGQRRAGLLWFASVWQMLNPGSAPAGHLAADPASAPGVFVFSGAPVAVPEATFFAFDDQSIPFRRNLHLTMVQPEKHGSSVLQRGGKGTFDELRAEYYGTVLKVDGHFRMWYVGYGFEDPAVRTYAGTSVHVGYAESDDGIHWVKPNLGLVNYHGNTANNIVAIEPEDYTRQLPDRNVHIIYDAADPDPTRRYKMMLYAPYAGTRWRGRCTMIPLLSADGLHWRYALPVKLVHKEDKVYPQLELSSIVMPEEHLEGGSFVRYGGIYYENGQGLNLPDGSTSGRVDNTFWSSDFTHWQPEKALSFVRHGYDEREHRPGAATVALHGEGEQVHEGTALWNRGNTLVGIYGRWQGGRGLGSSRIDLGLVSSVDAIHFDEPDPTFEFATPGKAGEWDSGGVLQGQGFQNMGGRTYFWYGSWNLTASGDKFDYAADLLNSHGEIGLMTLREDGFGYFSVLDPKKAQPGDTFETGQGSLLTAPFRINGSAAQAYVNVEAAAAGELAVELLDGQGVPLPGFGLSDFIRVETDGIRQPARWKDHPLIPAGGPYRLRVALRHGASASPRLYALYLDAVPAR